MNKKLVSLLMSGAMISAVGTTAYASTTTPIVKAAQPTTSIAKPATATTSKSFSATSSSTKTFTSSTKSSEHKTLKVGLNYKYIKAQLEAGQTVSQIKASLIANYKTKLSQDVIEKKITQDQANKKEATFIKHIDKINILRGVVNGSVMKDLEAGKTLTQAKTDALNARATNINKLLSEHKITQNQANKREAAVKKELASNRGIFIKEGIVNQVRKDIDAGKTLSQAKEYVIANANTHLQNLVKEGKLKQANLDKIEKKVDNKIEHSDAFKHISNIVWVQKALESGQTATQIKSTFVSKLNQREAKVTINKNLSQTQVNKIKMHIANIQKAIANKSIFSGLMNK